MHLLQKSAITLLAISLCLVIPNTFAQNIQDYKLGVGDSIRVDVWDEPDLSFDITISDNGAFDYPFLGSIKASGLSITELQQLLKNGLSPDYLLHPDIRIQIINYRGFYIRGQVKSPGKYPFQPGLTLRKAIALAGGLTARASKGKANILSDGEQEESKATPDTVIKPGDIINVDQSFF